MIENPQCPGRYQAKLGANGYLGQFGTVSEAQRVYDEACWDKYHDLLRLSAMNRADYRVLAYEYYDIPVGHPQRSMNDDS